MLQTMSAKQFAEWQQFYTQDPWGDRRADLRSALAASALLNIWRNPKSKPVEPMDFMPYEHKAPITEGEIENRITTFMARYQK